LTLTAEAWFLSFACYRNRKIVATNRAEMSRAAWSYLVAPILCALPFAWLVAVITTQARQFPADALSQTFHLMFVAHVHGIVALGCLTLHLLQRDFSLPELKKSWKGIIAGIAALGMMTLTFQGAFDNFLNPNSAIFLPFPLLVLAAIWLSPAPASLLVAAWCVLSTLLTVSGKGPFAYNAAVAGQTANPAELGLFNIVMASITYLVSVGSSCLLRQLNIHEIALSAAGIELWEWEVKTGFSCAQGNPANGFLRDATGRLEDQQALARLAGTSPNDVAISDSWRALIHNGDKPKDGSATAETLESVGHILQRGKDRRPIKAIGLLQDLSALKTAEEALMALGYQKAKLRSLQANLSPHFLFNTLNVIRALVYINPDHAGHAITSLAGLLRRNLRTSDATLIGLGEELEQIEVLLRLARLRYRDRLATDIQVPDDLLETLVPPLLLFNLVENAITHGIGSLEQGGMITITAKASEERVWISIRNSGTLNENAARGIGTQDALQRLEMLFGGRAKFSLSQLYVGTVSAEVILPLPHVSFSSTHS